jgi:hypothetical protein
MCVQVGQGAGGGEGYSVIALVAKEIVQTFDFGTFAALSQKESDFCNFFWHSVLIPQARSQAMFTIIVLDEDNN